MANQITKEYLNYFVESQNPNFAIMLKGKWGAGKTYFIKGIIEEWNNKQVISKEDINLKPLYVSLNGISKKNEIIENLKSQITPLLYSKGAKFVTGIMKGFFKSALKIDFDYDNDDKSDGSVNINFDPISIFKSSNDKIKGNRILIFDDVERCKIPIDELYGYINDFVEHSECKVILISDEEKLDDVTKKDSNFKYSVFKEKIIGQTFEIKPDTDLAVEFFINSVSAEMKNHLEELKDLIIHSFEISEKENLRVLQRAIYDYERLFKFLDPELKKDKEKYKVLIKNYLGYFLIYFLEIKTGNTDISDFQQSLFLKDGKEKKYSKYDEIIKTYSLEHSTKLFTPFKLVDFISNGNYVDLIYEINNSSIFTSKREEKNWEKLWYWKLLDDDEFSSLLKQVDNDFFKTDKYHITEILHISGILISLFDEGLYSNKNKSQIVKKAKQLIKKLDLSDFKDTRGFSSLSWGSWQKGYASAKTPEFKSILDYTKNILATNKKIKSTQTIEEIFYGVNNDNVDDLYQKVRTYDDNLENIIEHEPFFSKLDSKKFAKVIFKLNNDSIFRLIQFIEYRYFPEKTFSNKTIENQQIEEKDFLKELNLLISKEIKKKENRTKPLRRHQLTELESMVSNSISRL
tara:strand:+ start:65 stop:1957 length:1893 start_codon:yes stop_codon:yes gene_type:complete